jgi:hypothetical protein
LSTRSKRIGESLKNMRREHDSRVGGSKGILTLGLPPAAARSTTLSPSRLAVIIIVLVGLTDSLFILSLKSSSLTIYDFEVQNIYLPSGRANWIYGTAISNSLHWTLNAMKRDRVTVIERTVELRKGRP